MSVDPCAAVNCRLLFVYGTLRRGFRLHYHLVRLGATFEMRGKVGGELFDLGSYPGACPVKGGGGWFHGELFQLRQPTCDLEVLDRVEEFIPAAPERSEFVRALGQVVLTNGERQSAWVYWLGPKNAPGRRRITSGDYAKWQAGVGSGEA